MSLTTFAATSAFYSPAQLVPKWPCRLPKLAKVGRHLVVWADVKLISTGEACRRGLAAGIDCRTSPSGHFVQLILVPGSVAGNHIFSTKIDIIGIQRLSTILEYIIEFITIRVRRHN